MIQVGEVTNGRIASGKIAKGPSASLLISKRATKSMEVAVKRKERGGTVGSSD